MAEALHLPDWDNEIARDFVTEVELATTSREHIHPRTLTTAGEQAWDAAWPALLKASAAHATKERWVTNELFQRGYFSRLSAAEQVAEQHFKRFYIAAVCHRAIALRQTNVWIYRARPSRQPRSGSEKKVRASTGLNPSTVLASMRSLDGTHAHELTRFRSGLAVTLQHPLPSAARKRP